MQSKNYFVQVVGCKVNQVEAGMLAEQLENAGWQEAKSPVQAEVVLIHTCTVTQRADRDSRRLVEAAREVNPAALVAVSGCLAEMEAAGLAGLPGVLVIRQDDRSRAVELIEYRLRGGDFQAASLEPNPGFFGSSRTRGRSRALIKIQDGCDGACSYCRVHLARGVPVSRPLSAILKEARERLDQGFQELVLTGVNLGCWEPGLPPLLEALAKLSGRFRIRLTSIEPQHLTPELVRALPGLGERICPHLHIPIQSGDSHVLRAMNRRYTAEALRDQLQELCGRWPGVVLTGDMIVGFPGETREAFENSCRLAQACGFVRLHVLPYSRRPGTPAASYPNQLAAREITERARELRHLSETWGRRFRESLLGRPVTVLLEQEQASGMWSGTTENYVKALMAAHGPSGRLACGRVTAVQGDRVEVAAEEAHA